MTHTNYALTTGKAERAIIIGGGIGGLLTARVLSTYYKEVLIVDKDTFPERPDNRSGTPQAFHPHRFTQRGKLITDRLFPGYENDLVAQGAPSVLNKTIHNMNQYGTIEMQYPRNDVKFSRALLEWTLRKQVQKISNVSFLTNHNVMDLLMTIDRTVVTGVKVSERGKSEQEHSLHADLIIDTSGRSSKLMNWLQNYGYDVPESDRLKVSLGYSTRRYKVPSHLQHLTEKWDTINIAGQPTKETFTGVFSFIENNIAEVLIYRPGGHYPPTNTGEFEQTITQLPSPIIGEILYDFEPICSPRSYRVPELFRHHFEQMERWPSGLLVLGDAFCIYDPIFGQGMTVAAIEVEVLESCLQEQQHNPTPHFEQRVLKKMQDVIEPAWWLNCATDLQWKGVEYVSSQQLKGISFGQRYMDLFLKYVTTKRDFKLYGMYWSVNSLAVSPCTIFDPQLVKTILTSSNAGKRFLDELLLAYGQSLDKVLNQIIPNFSQTAFASVNQ